MSVRRAGKEDRAAVGRLLDEAFRDDPVSVWVFPDEAERRARNGILLGVFLDVAFAEGRVEVTEDGAAAALWLPVPAGPQRDDDTPALVRQAVAPDNERIELVGKLVESAHPRGRAHEYLQLVAVAPERQGQGLGGALLRAALDRCDREGTPAYLEASTVRSRGLYERLGFVQLGPALVLPDGPSMWPMWRAPR